METDPFRDARPYFIAEAGVNHNGDVSKGVDLIEAAADAGADAVKFQTFDTDRLVVSAAPTAEYQQDRTDKESQREMLQQYELSRAEHRRLVEASKRHGIDFLSTPFDPGSAAMLDDLGVPAFKIGSGDLTNHLLLKRVAQFGAPMIVSTGMATLSEVTAARSVIRSEAPDIDLILLHCTSTYPASVDDVNLRAMETMDAEFPDPVGYSDHTLDIETPGFAVAAGATVIEKHFTLDASLSGPDHEMSLEPPELERAVDIARTAWKSRGHPEKRPVDAESENRYLSRRGLYAAESIPAGTELAETHIDILRPADGLSPTRYFEILSRRTEAPVEEGEPITAEIVDAPAENESE